MTEKIRRQIENEKLEIGFFIYKESKKKDVEQLMHI